MSMSCGLGRKLKSHELRISCLEQSPSSVDQVSVCKPRTNQNSSTIMKTALIPMCVLGLVALLAITAEALGRLDNGKYACVNLKDIEPCEGFPYENFPICDYCHLGFFGQCSETGLHVRNCPTIYQTNGVGRRLVYDPTIKACAETSPDCPIAE
ncbi:hypothetical protein RRG08_017323 [Elysia crispata]|uniref:Uncharacterized protein n=1 Tax=Elysia crispata TaxID=231223 RepID=A0AAE1E5K0_9GAST|nr:hypothetical protein RRG08_017323 [Elysia crispata]